MQKSKSSRSDAELLKRRGDGAFHGQRVRAELGEASASVKTGSAAGRHADDNQLNLQGRPIFCPAVATDAINERTK